MFQTCCTSHHRVYGPLGHHVSEDELCLCEMGNTVGGLHRDSACPDHDQLPGASSAIVGSHRSGDILGSSGPDCWSPNEAAPTTMEWSKVGSSQVIWTHFRHNQFQNHQSIKVQNGTLSWQTHRNQPPRPFLRPRKNVIIIY